MTSFLVSSTWEMWTLPLKISCLYPCKKQDFSRLLEVVSTHLSMMRIPPRRNFEGFRDDDYTTSLGPCSNAYPLFQGTWKAVRHRGQSTLVINQPLKAVALLIIPRAVQQLDGAGGSVLSNCNLCFDMWGNLCNSCLFHCRCDPFEQDPTFWKPKCLNDFVDYACSKPCVQYLN